VSTIKRWNKQPEFRAMVNSSPDIRAGLPLVEARRAHPESQGGVRSRIWVTSGRDGNGEILGSFIPPSAYEDTHAVLHVHVVPAAAVDGVRASIAAKEYPAESLITTDGPSFGLVRLNPPPGSDRTSYQADALDYGRDGYATELEAMLAEGWTVADPAALDGLQLRLNEDGKLEQISS
jgi:hypothetical protein